MLKEEIMANVKELKAEMEVLEQRFRELICKEPEALEALRKRNENSGGEMFVQDTKKALLIIESRIRGSIKVFNKEMTSRWGRDKRSTFQSLLKDTESLLEKMRKLLEGGYAFQSEIR